MILLILEPVVLVRYNLFLLPHEAHETTASKAAHPRIIGSTTANLCASDHGAAAWHCLSMAPLGHLHVEAVHICLTN